MGVLRSLEEDIIRDLYLTYLSELIYLDMSWGCQRRAAMKGRPYEQFYWIRLIRLEINTENSLGHARLDGISSPQDLARPFFLLAGFFRDSLDGLSERGTTPSLI